MCLVGEEDHFIVGGPVVASIHHKHTHITPTAWERERGIFYFYFYCFFFFGHRFKGWMTIPELLRNVKISSLNTKQKKSDTYPEIAIEASISRGEINVAGNGIYEWIQWKTAQSISVRTYLTRCVVYGHGGMWRTPFITFFLIVLRIFVISILLN